MTSRRRTSWQRAATAAALLGAASGVQATDWPAYGGGNGETHYSTEDAVTPSTIARLKPAWSTLLDVPRANAEPIEVGGVVYVAAGLSRAMVAGVTASSVL